MKKPKPRSPSWVAKQQAWRFLFVLVVVLVLASSTFILDQIFQVATRLHSVHLKSLSVGASTILPERVDEDIPKVEASSSILRSMVEPRILHFLLKSEPQNEGLEGLVSVRDIVAFPEEVMLLVEVKSGFSSSVAPRKNDVVCLFGKNHRTGVFTVEWNDDNHSVLAVRCEHPPEKVLLESNRQATIILKESNFVLPSSVKYTTNSSWTPLVYETVTDADSVILFVKGLVNSKGRPDNFSRILNELHCRFGDDVRTPVTMVTQEVVRCELPPKDSIEELEGARVSLFTPKVGLLESVAYFNTPPGKLTMKSGKKQFNICACTMLWNQGQFLREWIMYHGFLGIERWYLYDNNSDDDIEEVLGGLQSAYNVTRHPWPWIKTQEAGFSHCALRAKADCDWVFFADVDEFVYPIKDLMELVYGSSSGKASQESWVEGKSPANWVDLVEKAASPRRSSVLQSLIARTLKRGQSLGEKNVGEVRLLCHNFGPSGLSRSPLEGVMVGYTCRMERPRRHKSFLYLNAMNDNLLNVVHHFALKDGYKQMTVRASIAVINHYKFQAWEVFKAKFVRRVATYVVDWKEQTALSNDRAPGLGLEAVEPEDWPSRYCEEVDWGLKNFTENAFRDPRTKLMPWQGQ